MQLPKSLAAWAKPLEGFSLDAAEALVPLVRRLAAAIGPFPEASHSASGEPDGFSGLSSKGAYDRLLVSEWLLADEMPDEFLRRAAMREHLFLHLNRTDPLENRASCVLFDAGPRQLGSPRLAHLALLVVFSQRAAAAKANFTWGILQDKERALPEVVSRAGVHRLLGARTSRDADESDISEWRARLAASQIHDLWTIGSPASPRLSNSFLNVEDILEPRARQLRVTICSRAQRREVLLDLPSERDCAKLLRDPYTSRAAQTPVVDANRRANSSLVFDPSNKYVYALSPKGDALVFTVPNSPSASVYPPKLHPRLVPEPIVAITRVKQTTVVVSGSFFALRLRHIGVAIDLPAGEYKIDAPPPFVPFTMSGPTPMLRSCGYRLGPPLSLLVLDGEGTLFRLSKPSQTDQPLVAQREASHVLALSQNAAVPRYIGKRDDGLWCSVCQTSKPLNLNLQQAFYGWGGPLADNDHGFVAVQDDQGTWTLIGKDFRESWNEQPSGKVVGVFRPDMSHAPGLLVLQEDQCTVTLEWRGWQRTLITTQSPILHCATTPSSNFVAYLTVKGDLSIYAGGLGRAICHYRASEAE